MANYGAAAPARRETHRGFSGTYARYVGRVGALAVALGVGAAIAGTPGVAWATPDTTTPAENPGADTTKVDAPAPTGTTAPEPATPPKPKPKPAGKTTPDPTDPTEPKPDPPSQSSATINQGSSPAVTVSGSGGLNTTVGADDLSTAAPEPDEPRVPAPNRLSVNKNDNSRQPVNPVAAPADPVTAVASAVVNITKTVISIAAPTATTNPKPEPAPIALARTATPTIDATRTTTLAPDTAPEPAGIAAVVTHIVTTVLSPFVNPSPDTPAGPVFALAVLAFVRREIDTTTTKLATPPTDETLTSQTVAPMAFARAAAPTTLAAAAPPPPPSGLLPTIAAVVTGVGNTVGGVLGFLGGIIGGVFNAPPTANPQFTSIDPITAAVTGKLNATDPNGDALSYAVTTAPPAARGSVTVVNSGPTAGTFTYTPTAAARAAALASPGPDVDSFTITITDARGAKTAVAINNAPITPTNRAPVASAPPSFGDPDPDTGVVIGNLNVIDPDGNPLTYTVSAAPSKGTVVVDANGTFTYTPEPQARLDAYSAEGSSPPAGFAAFAAAGASSTDGFNATASDGHGGTLAVTVSGIQIDPAAAVVTDTIQVGSGPQGIAIAGNKLYVANAGSSTMSVIDVSNTSTDEVVTAIPVGQAYRVVASPDGTRVYATSRSTDKVSIINTTNDSVVNIAVGGTPLGLTVSPDGNKVYVARGGANTIAVIDTANNNAVSYIDIGQPSSDIALNRDGTRAYITNEASNGITVINTATGNPITTISTAVPQRALALHPTRNEVYVTSNSGASVIDTTTNTITPIPGTEGGRPDVAFNPSGTHAYLTGSVFVTVVDTSTKTVVDDLIYVGKLTWDVAVHPDRTRAYVTNVNDGTISVITFAQHAEPVTDLQLQNASFLAKSADGSQAFAVYSPTGAAESYLAVIDTETNDVRSIPLHGLSPGRAAVSNDGTHAVVVVTDAQNSASALAIVDTVAGTATTVPVASSFDPRISPDGRYAYVLGSGGSGTMDVVIVDTATYATTTVSIPAVAAHYVNITARPDSDGVVADTLVVDGEKLVVINNDGTVVGTYPLPGTSLDRPDPFFSPGGSHVYQRSAVSSGPNVGTYVTTVDVAAATAHNTKIDDDAESYLALASSADGSRVYAFHGDGVAVLDQDGDVLGQIPLTTDYTYFVVAADKRHAAAVNGTSLAVIDLEAGTVRTTTAEAGGEVALSPDGRWIAFARLSDTSFVVMDTTNFATTTVDIVDYPEYGGFVGPIAFSDDGRFAYAEVQTGEFADELLVIFDTSTKTHRMVDTGFIYPGRIRVAFTPSHYYVIASKSFDDYATTVVAVSLS